MPIATAPLSLSSILKEKTRHLHSLAERSGVVADILHGRISRSGYALYLRNLVPAYQQLERGLERRRRTPMLRELAQRQVYRSRALAADLTSLWGEDWDAGLALLPVAGRYADHIAAAAEGSGEGLLGHAYVRYLGDLNGGQVLARLLTKSLDLSPRNLSFYAFPAIGDLADFRRTYRQALDRSAASLLDWTAVIGSAVSAFESNIQISDAVRRAILEA
jgi:heme oxygenase